MTKDELYIAQYNTEDYRMVAEYLENKHRRVLDRIRKDADNKRHLRKIAEKRGA